MIALRPARRLAYALGNSWTMVATEPRATLRYATVSCRARRGWLAREAGPPAPPEPRLLDRVRAALRARHGSRRTEEVYVAWIHRYVLFHGKRHPTAMGAPEVTRFLTSLAVEGHVAASTQNQALSALLLHDHDLHARPEAWPGGSPEPCGPDIPSVIRPAAFAPKSAKIRSVRAQPIQAPPARAYRAEPAGSKGRRAETQGKYDAGIGCNLSQRLRCYADLPILQPNCS